MNPLADILSPAIRKYLYAAVFLALLVYSAFQLADGDWAAMVGSLLTSLAPLLAASNTPSTSLDPAGVYTGEIDDLTYEESGGVEYPEGEDDYDGEPLTAESDPLYGTQEPLYRPGSDETGFGGDAPPPSR